ncbi:MAG: alpha/beta hydrolase-fold protein [Bacteroidota bacterium]
MNKKPNKLQNKVLLLFLSIILLSTNVSFAQNKLKIVQGEELSIKSTFLKEDRVVSIFLPANYETSSQKYPVIYLLDGRTHFQHATSAVNFLSQRGITPQMIVVAVHNIDRTKDFSPVHDKRMPTSGGAEKFLSFVSDELTKKIDKNYRTSDFKILMGHSFGGTFAVYSLLTKPEVFNAYIAISPYIHYVDNYLVKEAKKSLKSKYDNQKYFYMTVGDEPTYFSALAEFYSLVKEKSNNAINLEYVKMSAENHGSIPYLSLFNGLRFIFSDWQLPREMLAQGLSAIDDHYKNISAKYGFDVTTPENVINMLGYRYLQNKNFESAIKIFAENVKRYPKSANVYDSLGEAYENNKQLKLAEKNYQKAYDLGVIQLNRNILVYKKNLERVQKK